MRVTEVENVQQRRIQREKHDLEILLRESLLRAVAIDGKVKVVPRIGIAVKLPFYRLAKISLGIVYMGRDGKNQMKDKDKGGPGNGGPASAARRRLRIVRGGLRGKDAPYAPHGRPEKQQSGCQG